MAVLHQLAARHMQLGAHRAKVSELAASSWRWTPQIIGKSLQTLQLVESQQQAAVCCRQVSRCWTRLTCIQNSKLSGSESRIWHHAAAGGLHTGICRWRGAPVQQVSGCSMF